EFFKNNEKTMFVERDELGRFKKQFEVIKNIQGTVIEFGSRYDVLYDTLKRYNSETLKYISASSQIIPSGLFELSESGIKKVIKNNEIPEEINKIFEVLGEKSTRGGEGLYFQPPTTSVPELSEKYLGASYLGLFTNEEKGI